MEELAEENLKLEERLEDADRVDRARYQLMQDVVDLNRENRRYVQYSHAQLLRYKTSVKEKIITFITRLWRDNDDLHVQLRESERDFRDQQEERAAHGRTIRRLEEQVAAHQRLNAAMWRANANLMNTVRTQEGELARLQNQLMERDRQSGQEKGKAEGGDDVKREGHGRGQALGE